MRVGLDATPLLGVRTGVGTYTANLLDALRGGQDPPDLVATVFTARGGGRLATQLPDGVAVQSRRVPARLLRTSWLAGLGPSTEVLAGFLDVFHGTNFVVPPAHTAATVVTIHDLNYLKDPASVASASLAYRELVPLALRRGAHVCTPSHAVAAQVRDAYAIEPERVHATPLGVDPIWGLPARISPHPRTSWGLPADYLVCLGTLEPRKNLRKVIDAYRLAEQRHVDLPPLALVGAPGWGQALDVSRLAPRRVRMLGHLPFEEVRALVTSATALIFPSLDEGFGLPPLEALACGTAVVAADLEVTHEVLGDQATFADPRDAESLLAAIQSTLLTPAGTEATRRARAAEFTWESCAEATMRVYRAALAARR